MGRSLLSSASLFSWMDLDFSSIARSLSSSVSRWGTELDFSFARLTPPNWTLPSSLYWPPLGPGFSSVVDTVLWAAATALESVVLVSMLCCFFLFCGCTL